MTFSFHPEAEEEFNAAIGYYEGHEAGLGYDFSAEVFTTIQNIINYPEGWPAVEGDIRRSLVNRFPYCVLYKCGSVRSIHTRGDALAKTPRLLKGQVLKGRITRR